eukprot:743742_1
MGALFWCRTISLLCVLLNSTFVANASEHRSKIFQSIFRSVSKALNHPCPDSMISYNITSCTTPNLCTMQCNPGWFIVSDDGKLLNSSEVRCITDEVPLFKLPIFTWD